VRELDTDLVVLGGDFVSHARSDIDGLERVLARFRGRDGVVAVLGNHDHWVDPDQVGAAVERSGATLLHNRHRLFRRGAAVLAVCLGGRGQRVDPTVAQPPRAPGDTADDGYLRETTNRTSTVSAVWGATVQKHSTPIRRLTPSTSASAMPGTSRYVISSVVPSMIRYATGRPSRR